MLDEENNKSAEFAACKKCKKVVYDSRKVGTWKSATKPINEYFTNKRKARKREDRDSI